MDLTKVKRAIVRVATELVGVRRDVEMQSFDQDISEEVKKQLVDLSKRLQSATVMAAEINADIVKLERANQVRQDEAVTKQRSGKHPWRVTT